MDAASVAATFTELGGSFVCPPVVLARHLEKVQGLVFDWDGVFTTAAKQGSGAVTSFSEADSMGTNMLRFGLWRRGGKLPATVIVTGENNPTAVEFAQREHFDAVYMGVRNKHHVVQHLETQWKLVPAQLACVFDDINDLPVAAACLLRVLVRRAASPLLRALAIEKKLCDYVTAQDGSNHAVRETCELMLGLMGEFDAVVASRTAVDDDYQLYFGQRQSVTTSVFVERQGGIVPL